MAQVGFHQVCRGQYGRNCISQRCSWPDPLSKYSPDSGYRDRQGQTWNPTSATFLFPVKALSTVFRAKYLDALQELYAEHALRFTDATGALETPTAFDTFVKRLRQTKWIVYAKPPFEYPS